MTSTDPFYNFKQPIYYIDAQRTGGFVEKRSLTIAEKRLAAKESQREFLKRKKR